MLPNRAGFTDARFPINDVTIPTVIGAVNNQMRHLHVGDVGKNINNVIQGTMITTGEVQQTQCWHVIKGIVLDIRDIFDGLERKL